MALQVHTISTIGVKTVISVNKAIYAMVIAVVIYLLGDLGMQIVASFGDLKLEQITTAVCLLSMSWMTS